MMDEPTFTKVKDLGSELGLVDESGPREEGSGFKISDLFFWRSKLQKDFAKSSHEAVMLDMGHFWNTKTHGEIPLGLTAQDLKESSAQVKADLKSSHPLQSMKKEEGIAAAAAAAIAAVDAGKEDDRMTGGRNTPPTPSDIRRFMKVPSIARGAGAGIEVSWSPPQDPNPRTLKATKSFVSFGDKSGLANQEGSSQKKLLRLYQILSPALIYRGRIFGSKLSLKVIGSFHKSLFASLKTHPPLSLSLSLKG